MHVLAEFMFNEDMPIRITRQITGLVSTFQNYNTARMLGLVSMFYPEVASEIYNLLFFRMWEVFPVSRTVFHLVHMSASYYRGSILLCYNCFTSKDQVVLFLPL